MTKVSTLLILSISSILMACGQGFEEKSSGDFPSQQSSARIIYDEPTAISKEPFKQQKVVVNIRELYVNQESFRNKNENIEVKVDYLASVNNISEDILLPQDTKISVTINNNCKEESDTKISQVRTWTQSFPQYPISTQVYDVSLPYDVYLSELEVDVQSDTCVIGISEFQELSTESFYVDDPMYSQQAHLPAIKAEESYGFFDSPSLGNKEEVLVAVIDSGIDYNHPDLINVMWTNGSGQHGIDLHSSDNDPMDDCGHGTHVAGLIAAQTNNGVGVAGVAGKNVKIMAIRTLGKRSDGSCGGSTSTNGIYYAIDNGAEIINMSLGGIGQSPTMATALNAAASAGLVVLVAAGNNGKELNADFFVSPAGYGSSIDGVITVGSVDAITGSRSSFSNFSTSFVELGAPGSQKDTSGLLSTVPTTMGNYTRYQGTSMATPVAAGAAALLVSSLKSNSIDYDPAIIEALMKSGSPNNPALDTAFSGGKTLNVKSLADTIQQFIITTDGGFQ